jgi:tripartite-type tricarboxylate transporter receptor subunit TctC
VENRPGAGTLLAGRQVATAPADGYTLLMATSTTLGISQGLFAKPSIQVGDLSGIAMLGAVTLFLVARTDFPATTVPELVAALKSKPDHYTFASPGNGTPHHLLSEMLKNQAGVSALHVPYNGSPSAMADLLAGRVDLLIIDATVALPQMKAGKLRALATTASKRSALAPDVAALKEFFPDMDLQVWQGMVGPNDLPTEIASRLHGEINAALADPQFRSRLVGMGLEPISMSREEFNVMIRKDAPRWHALVKRSGAKVD